MYVELHARSAFSFLEGAALPEALAERAARLGQPALALLDRDGLYGAPRLYRAATRLGIAPLVGAEVTLAGGGRLPLLVEDREGYQNLCRLLTRMKMRVPKGAAQWKGEAQPAVRAAAEGEASEMDREARSAPSRADMGRRASVSEPGERSESNG
jgi:error-prone DNA polymerase